MGSTVDATGLILKPALNHYFAMLCRLNHVLANNFATIIPHNLTFIRRLCRRAAEVSTDHTLVKPIKPKFWLVGKLALEAHSCVKLV